MADSKVAIIKQDGNRPKVPKPLYIVTRQVYDYAYENANKSEEQFALNKK